MKTIPPCFKCGKELKNVGATVDEDINQPDDGLAFMTHGHYGSTVFDPMNSNVWLEINVCDECLTTHIGNVLHAAKLDKSFTTPVLYETWNRYKHG